MKEKNAKIVYFLFWWEIYHIIANILCNILFLQIVFHFTVILYLILYFNFKYIIKRNCNFFYISSILFLLHQLILIS